ncbi:hypothetical protein AB0M86_46235 [Streptomyces sp. NPDC051639]|uniref:hypothetical protein n=1 Tax=Streptomyces sp. NPDC051639 TaxID=3155671 RepID=UPI003414B4EC
MTHGGLKQAFQDLRVGGASDVDHDASTYLWLQLSEQDVQTRPQGIIDCPLWHLEVDFNSLW